MAGAPKTEVFLERDARLSTSSLWGFVRQFYDDKGVRAWADRLIPSHVTSNAFMAEAYARLIMRFLQDCASQPAGSPLALDPDEPVYIVELGAGPGYFAHLVLSKLLDLQRRVTFAAPRVCYVATDFTRSNIEQWKAHRCLQPYIEYGLFDAARFDASADEHLTLEIGGRRLDAGSVKNPVIVIANYLFDTLEQDAFRVQHGVLEEARVSLRARPDADPRARYPLEGVEFDFSYREFDEPYYDDPVLDGILAEYTEQLGDASVPFPVGAIRCLRNLSRLSSDRLLVISADKGYSSLHHLGSPGDPAIVHHAGCISMMVNYQALGRVVEAGGGFMMASSNRDTSLELVVLSTVAADLAPETRTAFYESMERFGPLDVYPITTAPLERPSLDHLLALLRMAAYDPFTFSSLRPALLDAIADPTPSQLRRLRQALIEVWRLYFPLDDGRDLAFDLGFTFYALRQWPDAYQFYEKSIELGGPHAVTLYNMGLCQYRLGRVASALEHFERSLGLDPAYGPAREWKLRVTAELEALPEPLGETAPESAAEPEALEHTG
jgi:tetratricopeptide (TPR) repeat protein